MKKSEALDRVRAVCRTRHFAWNTEQAYCAQVARFFDFCATHRDLATPEARVRGWLEAMAPHCAAKTQAQALNAIVFFYKAIEQPLGELGAWSKARLPRRLPVWLSPDEMRRLLALADGTRGLMLELYYGCGLRLMEGVRLRTGDLDLGQRLLTVRGAKRDKDRTVPIPHALVPRLAAHLARVRALWEADALRGLPPVALPAGLERKYPNAGREWVWFWAFPSAVLSTDPRSGLVRRHHAHEDAMIKALKRLVARAAIAKRVTMHALRHSFATHLLMAGVPIHTLARLLGHESIETTEIYLHVLPREVAASPSPLDLLRERDTIVPLYALPGGQSAALSA